jgi:transposase
MKDDDKQRYKRRNRIERMFGGLKDWRRVATRYNRCPETFFFAIALASAWNGCGQPQDQALQSWAPP